jgi:hypothetical protein
MVAWVARCNKKTTSVILTAFQCQQEKFADLAVGMMTYVAALAVFLLHLEQHLPLPFGDRQVEINPVAWAMVT